MAVTEKTCTKCDETKPIDDFRERTNDRGHTFRIGQCKGCVSKYNAAWEKQHPRKNRNVGRHGLTMDDYKALLKSQNGLCGNPVCTNEPKVIDHDHSCCPGKHSCGKCVRGLLCASCNTAEGMLGSDANKALGLAEYIIMTRSNNNGMD